MEKIKVLIADDIMILRQGLKAVVEQDPDLEVVALAQNGKEAFDKCKIHHPQVVLMDMRMPDYDGAYGIRAIKEALPSTKVLVLTTFDDDETIAKAVESGADGYLLKEMQDAQVIASIKSVNAGMSIFGSGIYESMRRNLQKPSVPAKTTESETLNFTDRELDMIRLVAQGYDNKEISAELHLAEGTVRNQISHLLEKIQLKDRTQLAVYAVKHGLD